MRQAVLFRGEGAIAVMYIHILECCSLLRVLSHTYVRQQYICMCCAENSEQQAADIYLCFFHFRRVAVAVESLRGDSSRMVYSSSSRIVEPTWYVRWVADGMSAQRTGGAPHRLDGAGQQQSHTGG